MLIGRSDDPHNPCRVGPKGRSSVWEWIAEPIWASGGRRDKQAGHTTATHRIEFCSYPCTTGVSALRRRGRPVPPEHLADAGDDPVAVRKDMVFEDGAVGYRHLQGADPFHRGL